MRKKLKRKTICMFILEIICIIVFGVFLTVMQTNFSVNKQKENTSQKLQEMQSTIDSAKETANHSRETYDEIYRSKASSVAYMANNDANFTYTDAKMSELAAMMNVSNILIIDTAGNQLTHAESTAANFTYPRYNQLRTVFTSGEASEAFEVTLQDTTRRYYGARIDASRQVVIEQDPQELKQLLENTSSWESVLSNINVGLEGFSFAISSQNYTFLYHPNQDLVGKDALDVGLDVKNLEDNNFAWMDINGERFYCGVKNIDSENAYVICAVPESEIISSRNVTVGIVLFLFLIITAVVIVYAILFLQQNNYTSKDYKHFGKLSYNKAVAKKIIPLCIVGALVIFISSFYMQLLFSLSLYSISNTKQTEEVRTTLAQNEENISLITEQYNQRYLNKAQIASYILSGNPNLDTKADLEELSQVLGVEFIMLFDSNGNELVSNSSYINFHISNDPNDQSYKFQKLLQGVEYVIQDAQPDEISGTYYQYIGVTMYDAEQNPNGFLQISVIPDKLQEALASTTLPSVLSTVKASSGGFAFAVDKESHTFSYHPEEWLDGNSALKYGMTENEFRDKYSDYITISNERYYGASLETDDDYIYIVTPENRITNSSLPLALMSTFVSILCLFFIFVILSFEYKAEIGEEGMSTESNDPGATFNITTPDGMIKKTVSAASRWSNISLKWKDETPEQQILSILKGLLSIFAVLICSLVVFKNFFFSKNSIFLYVINGNWEKNVNIFSITGCLMIICVSSVIVMILRKILYALSRVFGARGETVCRLLRNFIKYISVIAVLYYSFALFGVDTATLLASAGILSLVIGFGAKTLVSDIIAGLFIIFEGEFQVGDIVTISGWRGTVQEIGIRTTKIVDPGDNVKIISNSDINGVINMTRKHSFCSCDIGIEYGESLERVESVLKKELPLIGKRLPSITSGPFYKGVVSLGDNSVNIRILAQCAEADRVQLGRDLNREMKLLFDQNDINIPFPQVVINQPKEYKEATDLEKFQAEHFNRSQKKLSKNIGEEVNDSEF